MRWVDEVGGRNEKVLVEEADFVVPRLGGSKARWRQIIVCSISTSC